MLTDLIRDLDPSVWDVPREFVILGYNVTATPKKIVMHVLHARDSPLGADRHPLPPEWSGHGVVGFSGQPGPGRRVPA